jgi:hypothetical protein
MFNQVPAVRLPLASRIGQTNVITVPSAAPTNSKAVLNESYKCYKHSSLNPSVTRKLQ